ncbi:transcription initiation at TATA-containing promoter protein, variant 2 [Basidiobolus ranarum]|uniref:Transcription initiation at TATA-containing promoter protein, variant 2 n=1 Tax=Basidiobolus ranarum TaxID=34480 RepID=A0ABR2WK74_9FUNG
MIQEQHSYCSNILRALKRHPNAVHFLVPVNPTKLKVPDYPDIIKNPMDLGTIGNKLNDSRYHTMDQFVADMRLIFDNCYLYHGRDSIIGSLAQNLERAFNNQIEPQGRIPSSSTKSQESVYNSRAKVAKEDLVEPQTHWGTFISPKSCHNRLASTDLKKRPKKFMPRGHYRFCESILEELNRKRHANTVYPFLRPVDWRAMNLFDYPTIIKHPMDISTIKKNLESGSYVCIEQFETDFRLMFNNCFRYNPVNTPVYDMGKSIEKVFDLMWSKRPLSSSSVLRETSSKPRLNSAEKPFNEGNQTSQIAAMQRHSEFMTRQLESMKDLIQDKKVDRTLQSSWTTKVDMLRKSRSGTTSSHKLRKITVPKYSGYEDPPSSKSSGGGPDSSLGSSSSDTKDSPVPLRKRSSLAYSRSLMELNICNKTARYSDQIIPSGNQITSEAVPIGTLELATRAPNQKNQISNEHKVTDAVNTQNADQWVALIKDAEPNETQTGNKAIDLIWAKPSSDAKTKWEQVSISYEKDKKFAEQRGEETIR